MKQHTLSLPELLGLIERFFDCSLSDSEELQLRQTIAETSYSHPAIDEARAIMGVRAVYRARKPKGENLQKSVKPEVRNRRAALRPALSIAAAVAFVLTLGIYELVSPSSGSIGKNQCIAYTNGCCITDEDDVINLLREDLREFDDAVEASDRSFADELGDIAPIIESYESPM